MKKRKWIGIFIGLMAMMMGLSACSKENEKEDTVKLDPENPVALTVWHYYNGMQQQNFDELVQQFNETVGAEKGIYVEAHTKGNVNELADAVYASAKHEVGAETLPDIFASYADTAYDIDKMGLLADISDYVTEEEVSQYMEAYVQEGCWGEQKSLKLFPIAKSTEIFLLNETAWERFEQATGAKKSSLTTWEGLVETAKAYYEWTDSLTPDIAGDGQAFYGRDAFANYMIIGSLQLGKEMFQVENGKVTLQIDKEVMKRLWDCYYVPYVNGWFGAYGRFRSDDIKTGQIIALVGSTSGALYFPNEVTDDSGKTEAIACGVYTLPNFEGTSPYAVQQGAGMVVTKSTKEKEYAATVFLKWITQSENNIDFVLGSGYLPVRKDANDLTLLKQKMEEQNCDALLQDIITTGVETTTTYTLYTSKPFENGNSIRKITENHMQDAANEALAKRDELIASGMSREEAIKVLTSEEAFESWFEDFVTAMQAAVGQ